jgi:hypothetical protein
MAEKDYEIVLEWDKVNQVWRPLKYSSKSNIGRYAGKGFRFTEGERTELANATAVAKGVVGHPKAVLSDEVVDGQVTKTLLTVPETVLAQYNNVYTSTKPKIKETEEAQILTAGEFVGKVRARASGKEVKKETVAITSQEFGAREFVETQPETEEFLTSLPKKYYNKEEILQDGTAIDSGRGDGTQKFTYMLQDPNTLDPSTGEFLTVPIDAVLLPGTLNNYYVASMTDAINSISQDYIKKGKVAELKKMLWEANFMTAQQYTDSVRGNMASVFDENATAALRGALESVSVKNFPLLAQGRTEVMSLPDHLEDMFMPGGVPTTQIALPSSGDTNKILDDTYQTYYGRMPTAEEYETFNQEVQNFALENATRMTKAMTPEGTGINIFRGQETFGEADLQQIAEGLTQGNPERKAYYGVQEYGKAFDRVFGSGGLSSQTELTELLR